jgi:hypothetical protein
MKRVFLSLILLYSCSLYSQKRDNVWVLGYSGSEPPDTTKEVSNGILQINFKNGNPRIINNINVKIDLNHANSSISDKEGNVLFFFNGGNLFDKNLNLAKKENNLNVDTIVKLANQVRAQNSFFLPSISDESQTILFYKRETLIKKNGRFVGYDAELNIAILKNQGIDGLGEVIDRKINIITDTLELGKITATKHANGRDWWIISQRYEDNKYYKILLSDKGAKVYDLQEIGIDKSTYGGQAVFSPDGKFYINYDYATYLKDPHLVIFDFDRCTGQLSNPRNIFYEKEISAGGVAVSPNSRFLYVGFGDNMMQYDLWAKDIAISKKIVAIYDNFISFNYPTRYYLAQLAPDGKIYISTSGASPYLHVINKPDLEGAACNFVQRGLKLPFINAWSVPNHPNYRLGALKGSPCDSLGSVAVQEIKEEDFKVYPNPTRDILNVEIANSLNFDIILRDVTGRIIHQTTATNTTQIDVANFVNGIYICEFWQENKCRAKEKIIIIH